VTAQRRNEQANPHKRAALYLRISKVPKGTMSAEAHDGDTSYSVDDQRVRCEAVCEAAGYQVGPVFYDDGISAYRSLKDRPGYGDLKKAVSNGAFDVLVFDRQDRLARDQIETMQFIIDCARVGMTWHSAQEGQVDLSDTMAVMFAIFRGGEAQAYSDKISKNQRAANSRKREKGLPGAGGRPFGYERDKVTLCEREAELIRKGTEMVLSGAPKWEVLKMFRTSGIESVRGSEWHVASMVALLRRWRNAGWVEHGDAPYIEAVWPAIVSREDVENVRRILDRKGRAPGMWKQPTTLCAGIAKCTCGLGLVITNNDGLPAYRCSGIVSRGANPPGTHVTIRAQILDRKVREEVISRYLNRPTSSAAGQSEQRQLAAIYRRRDEVRAERAKIQSGYEAGIYTEAEAAEKVSKIAAKLDSIEAEITELAAASAHAAMLVEARVSLIADAPEGSLHGAYARALQEERGFTREEAVDHVLRWRWSLKGNAEEVQEMRDAIGKRFDDLPLDQKRNLLRSLVRVEVAPGRGAKRIDVTPL
jgi:site-specific DNA recombinase